MNKRIEILKRIARYGIKKKLPRKLLIYVITIVLLSLHIVSFVTSLVKYVFKMIFPNKHIVVCYVVTGIILSVLVIPHSSNRIDEEKVYGNVSEDDTIEIDIRDLNSDRANETENIKHEDVTDEKSVENQPIYPQYSDDELKNLSFYIKVNRLMNCITIYTADKFGNYTIPVKAMACSTGGENTPLGVYNIHQKYTFRKLLYGVYGQYASRIVGQILFHSSSYTGNSKDTMIAEEFNKLGQTASHGCIRLTTADAKWIYDYCLEGTTVEIYEDEYPGPLGKPEVITVPNDTVWDPTDEAAENPWNEQLPYIAAEDIEISVGHEIDLLSMAVAFDTCGNNISDRIITKGNVDVYTEGVYEIGYEVTDLLGRKAEKSIKITVKGI